MAKEIYFFSNGTNTLGNEGKMFAFTSEEKLIEFINNHPEISTLIQLGIFDIYKGGYAGEKPLGEQFIVDPE